MVNYPPTRTLNKDIQHTNDWKRIWRNKTSYGIIKYTLDDLIRLNGFDTASGSYNSEEWKALVSDALKRIHPTKSDHILELGCGSGAFLYAANQIMDANYYGIDYSNNLIEIAKKILPEAKFICDEAKELHFPDRTFDAIILHSVFQYFPSTAYAETVLKVWCQRIKKNGFLLLLDVNDIAFEETYHSLRSKKYKNYREYSYMYEGLDHTFYDKDELLSFISTIGMGNFKFFAHAVTEYGNSAFRLNFLCSKV